MTEDLLDPLRNDDDQDDEPRIDARAIAKRASGVRPTSRVPQQTDVSEPPGYEDPTAGGARFLSHLLTRSPFLDYFCQVAEASYQGKNAEPKVRKAQQDHKALFRFCVTADMVLRVIVAVLILVLIVAVAFKTLWPLTGSGG
ncbi:MAG: hypothetical protein JWO67_3452 [Streptosporangiaceae bacterium]|nr:hypothetical protein [Streptosporangiaceae bacterium]